MLSPRQFTRAFVAEKGETPARAVERLRAELARPAAVRVLVPQNATRLARQP